MSADYEPRGKSVMRAAELHSDELEELLEGTATTTFVHFFAPWCSECAPVREAWHLLAREYDFRAATRVVAVDCTGVGARACGMHDVRT